MYQRTCTFGAHPYWVFFGNPIDIVLLELRDITTEQFRMVNGIVLSYLTSLMCRVQIFRTCIWTVWGVITCGTGLHYFHWKISVYTSIQTNRTTEWWNENNITKQTKTWTQYEDWAQLKKPQIKTSFIEIPERKMAKYSKRLHKRIYKKIEMIRNIGSKWILLYRVFQRPCDIPRLFGLLSFCAEKILQNY